MIAAPCSSRWTVESLTAAFNEVLAAHDLKLGKLAQPVRVAVTGGTASPGIFEVLDVLGRERTIARLDRALARHFLTTPGRIYRYRRSSMRSRLMVRHLTLDQGTEGSSPSSSALHGSTTAFHLGPIV